MLATELDRLRKADLLVHLNEEECATFEKLLPEMRNALVTRRSRKRRPDPAETTSSSSRAAISRTRLSVEWFLSRSRRSAACAG